MNISDIGNRSIPFFGGSSGGAEKITIDSELNNTSTNPVQNKVIYSELLSKEDKSNIVQLANSNVSITLANNYEYRCGEVSSVTFTIPESVDDDFVSSVVFTSGSTATNFTADTSVKFTGADCIDEIFAPITNMRYNIILWYDGENICGAIQGNTI